MGYYARDGAYMHDSDDIPYRNTYGEKIKTTGGPSYDERVRDSEGQRRMNKYGEPLRGARTSSDSGVTYTTIDIAKIRAEKAKDDLKLQRMLDESRMDYENRKEAVKIIVQQKRAEYEKQSWLSKAVAKLRGKTFDKMKKQITEEAKQRVDKMSPEGVERFIEKANEGRSR